MPQSTAFIIGSFPSPLYKAFSEEKHARDFLERGILIMRSLSYFRETEDLKRKDKDEGEGRVKIVRQRPVIEYELASGKFLAASQQLGEVFFGTASTNPCYLYCFTGPEVDVDYLAAGKYGQYVLRIDEPNALVSEIASCLERHPDMPNTMWLYCIPVRYDRDQLVGELPESASHERLMMSCGQKDNRDCGDCEYRLVLRLPVPYDPPDEIRVELKKRPEHVDTARWPAKDQDASGKP